MSAEQPRVDKVVQVQIDRLVEEHADERPGEEIEALAHESASELEDAPIQAFVPNLVYNDVKTKLIESRPEEQVVSEPVRSKTEEDRLTS